MGMFSQVSEAASQTECGAYLDLEVQRKCVEAKDESESRYLTHWGYVFCRKFKNAREGGDSSENLKKWIAKTTYCLQKSVEKRRSNSCKDIEDSAIDDHLGCYKKSGFCRLKGDDIAVLTKTLFSVDLLDREKLPRSLLDGVKLLKCSFFENMKHVFAFAVDVFKALGKWTSKKARTTIKELIENIPKNRRDFDKYMLNASSAYFTGDSSPSSRNDFYSRFKRFDYSMSVEQFLNSEKMSSSSSLVELEGRLDRALSATQGAK
jgi:hypothetical protein